MRVVVLASGNGSNFQALVDALHDGSIAGLEIAALVCNVPGAPCLGRAVRAGIPAWLYPPVAASSAPGASRDARRRAYDRHLADIVAQWEPDYVLLLGWMRLLTTEFLSRFPLRVINMHPALPGMFPGTHAIEKAYAASREGTLDRTGVMLHLVPDEGVDCGPVLRQAEIPISPDDTLESLEAKVHAVEHRELLALVAELAASERQRTVCSTMQERT
ncbi:MAG: phosphoribosylglycinamide formyltransferase [Rectinemataceae bacterium]|nr:phosphoribosylglycinamide formyltransferase [Spirochaetaceae bacterium]